MLATIGSDQMILGIACIFLYIFGYFLLVFDRKVKYRLSYVLGIFFIIKIYVLFISLGDIDSRESYLSYLSSDAAHFHIPKINSIEAIGPIEYMLIFTEINGKITHILMYYWLLFFKNLSGININNPETISVFAYILNSLVNVATIFFLYNLLIKVHKNKTIAASGTFFFALNPFVIHYSSMVQKEALLFLAVVFCLHYLVFQKKWVLIIACLILFFDRPYMLLFPMAILLLSDKINIVLKFTAIIGILGLIEVFFGLINALSLHQAYLKGMADNSEYLIPLPGAVGDIIRILFSPIFIRPFLGGDLIGNNIFYNLYYFTLPLIYIFTLYSIFFLKHRIYSIPAITLILTFLIWPSHSTLKLTWLIPSLTLILPMFVISVNRSIKHLF